MSIFINRMNNKFVKMIGCSNECKYNKYTIWIKMCKWIIVIRGNLLMDSKGRLNSFQHFDKRFYHLTSYYTITDNYASQLTHQVQMFAH